MNSLWVMFGKWARRKRHSVSIVLIWALLEGRLNGCTAVFSGILNVDRWGSLSNGRDNCCYWSGSLFELQTNGFDGDDTIMKTMLIIWLLTVSPSSIRLIWIWTTFVFTSSRLLFQKSRPQQADYHQCGCFRQPSQPERAVSRHRQNSRTHMISIEATESKPQSTLLLTCKSLFFSAVSVWVNFTLTLQWLVDQLISWSKGN